MTNEEMQKILEYMMQRQEVVTEHLERLEVNQEKLQEEVRGLTTEVRGLAGVVRQLGEAQIQTQNDMSHLTKIVTGLVEIVTRDRNGDARN
jgi:predicted nuclease with TOPRIM domain